MGKDRQMVNYSCSASFQVRNFKTIVSRSVVKHFVFRRCVSRLILLYQHKESMISNPTIPVLQRREVLAPNPTDFTFDCVSFTLKRTGKVMRKVDSSPPIYSRTWKPVEENTHCDNKQTIEEGLAGVRLVAETLYVAKPIVHLASVGLWGNNTWKPWMASLLLDLAR